MRAASAQTAEPCLAVDLEELELSVEQADLIIIGSMASATALSPEAYLKGPAAEGDIPFGSAREECGAATVSEGDRLVAFLEVEDGIAGFPPEEAVFVLAGGFAVGGVGPEELTEAELVEDTRDITGQYAVPADEDEDGASIEWFGTVAWVAGALAIVFGIGLLLMRVWHRIDPT